VITVHSHNVCEFINLDGLYEGKPVVIDGSFVLKCSREIIEPASKCGDHIPHANGIGSARNVAEVNVQGLGCGFSVAKSRANDCELHEQTLFVIHDFGLRR